MIRTIIETNTLLYVMTAVGLLGIICQLVISRRYARLMRDASDTQLEKKDFMKQLRFRYRTDCKRSGDAANIPVFVRRQLMDYRFFRMNFHQWKRLAAGLFIASMLAAAAGLTYCFRLELLDTYGRNILWTMAGVTVATVLAALWTDLPYKSYRLQNRLEDYFYHSGASLDYTEAELEEPLEEPVKAKRKMPSVVGIRRRAEAPSETRAQREKRELKTSLTRIKDGMRETAAADSERERNREILRQMDTQEQERIIRDVLAEYLA